MKRNKIIGILLITAMIFSIGCTNNSGSSNEDTGIKSKEIVFEENVMDSSNTSVKITQEEINFSEPDGTEFQFQFYKDGKIYGSLASTERSMTELVGTQEFPIYGLMKENLYVLEENLQVNDTGEKVLAYFEGEGVKGINSKTFGEGRHVVNYYNYEANEIKPLSRKKYISSGINFAYLDKEIEIVRERLVEGNENFGYSLYNYNVNNKSLTAIQVIDIENEIVYDFKDEGEDVKFIVDIVYDESTEKFYGINTEGVIYELKFENETIVFNEKERLDLGGIALWNEEQVSLNKDGEIVIMYNFITNTYANNNIPMYDEKYMGNVGEGNELLITYNPSTNEMVRIMQNEKMEYEIISFWKDSNLFLLEKGRTKGREEEYYLGELKDDKIDIYQKIDIGDVSEKHVACYNKIINEDNTEVLLEFRTFNIYSDNYDRKIIRINIER